MKTVIVACGSGVATSTIVSSKLSNFLVSQRIEHKIIQCTIQEIGNHTANADLIITAMKLTVNFDIPYLFGGAFLTGINEEALHQKIVDVLK